MNTLSPTTRISRLLVLLFMVGSWMIPVQGQSTEQALRSMMEQRDAEIKKHIQPLIEKRATVEEEKKVEGLINDAIDFTEMGRQALGKYWADLTAEQQTEFVDVFAEIVRSQSLSDLEVYNSDVTIEDVSVTGDSAYVKTLTVYKDKPADVEYIMGLHTDTWWIYDIILDKVSTVGGYERSFKSAMRKRGYDGLMKSLYKKRDKIRTQS